MTNPKSTFLLLLASLLFATLANGQAISERTFKYIERVQKMMEEEAYDDALTYLERVQEFKMTDYDTAVIAQAKGEVLVSLERYLEAAESFEQALLLDELGDHYNQQLRLSCGQLFINEGQNERGIAHLEKWITEEDEPSAQVLITMATAYSRLEQFDNANIYVERAIRASDELHSNWYDLWLSLNFRKGDYEKCIEILHETIAYFPTQKKYWTQLSSIYLTKEEGAKSLAVLNLAYQKGFVNEPREIIHLAKMYLYQDIPVKAARILYQALSRGEIEPTEENYRLLADCWYRSQEFDEAKLAFKEAGEKSDTGEHDLYRAQMHLNSEEYTQAIQALEAAIDKGTKQEPSAIMMLAMAHFELKQFDEALEVLKQAERFPKIQEQGKQWSVFIREEKERLSAYAQVEESATESRN